MNSRLLLRTGTLVTLTFWNLGCLGGSSGGGSTPEIEVPPTATQLLAAGDFADFPSDSEGDVARATVLTPFTSTIPSSLYPSVRVQVDWTRREDTLDVGVYPAGCTATALGEAACLAVATGSRVGTSPRNVTNLTPTAGRNYVLAIRNRGPHRESGAFQVVVSYTAE